MANPKIREKLSCHHCGDDCGGKPLLYDEKPFCCQGCKMVYTVLSDNGMDDYYRFEKNPGISQKSSRQSSFEYLDDEAVINRLVQFRDSNSIRVVLKLPSIHCSSCLWLLENLNRLHKGVISSIVNFTRKEASILFKEDQISLRELVELLTKIGYEPFLKFNELGESKEDNQTNKSLLYRLGLAGFCFGNIMLLSFPEYLGFAKASSLFYLGYINIVLATPVLFYAGWDYIKSAYTGLKYKTLNIDLPIAIGMITLFSRSVYEVLSMTGEGYLDSFSGFVFFLLIGKWFQSFTYKALDFNRNYTSFLPISATFYLDGKWTTKSIDKIEIGDRLLIRNHEIIPVDGLVENGKGRIDYSFVTGESEIIYREIAEEVLAGGKQMGSNVEILATKKVDQSYLTQLWNEDAFSKKEVSDTSKLIGGISKWFTIVILGIAMVTFLYWFYTDRSMAYQVFTAVLIVACPCALALSIPFTYGNILRLLSQIGVYLKNVETIENIQEIDEIIFDKTGTITDNRKMNLKFEGNPLTEEMRSFIKSACMHSSHPLSKAIVEYFGEEEETEVDLYQDFVGQGFTSKFNTGMLRVGSSDFIFGTDTISRGGVFLEFDGKYIGQFHFEHAFREGVEDIVKELSTEYDLSVLSGDNDTEMNRVSSMFNVENIYFNQQPKDKLDYVKSHQNRGSKVMMIGDGLNDAGALKQSNVGIVISEENNNFSPACDGIIAADSFSKLLRVIKYIRLSRKIIYGAFAIAFLYNTIGLYFAVTGNLSPVVAAILMPLSSITVIVYGVSMSSIFYYLKLKRD